VFVAVSTGQKLPGAKPPITRTTTVLIRPEVRHSQEPKMAMSRPCLPLLQRRHVLAMYATGHAVDLMAEYPDSVTPTTVLHLWLAGAALLTSIVFIFFLLCDIIVVVRSSTIIN
jgi:hypothetical protein